MIITLDIETIPTSNESVKADFANDAQTNFKAPSTLTKEQAAIDLGITDKDTIKFTSKDSMIAQWSEKFKIEAAKESSDQQWRKTSFDGAYGHICVIGYAFDDQPALQFSSDKNEVGILECFFDDLDAYCSRNPNVRPVFVGHNLIDFDLRFIYQRAIVLGIKPSRNIPFHAKAWDDHVFDTMHRWDAKNRTSLDKLSRALGLKGKGDIDGSMVADYVAAGRIAEVAAYCIDDVELTRAVYKRMTFQ